MLRHMLLKKEISPIKVYNFLINYIYLKQRSRVSIKNILNFTRVHNPINRDESYVKQGICALSNLCQFCISMTCISSRYEVRTLASENKFIKVEKDPEIEVLTDNHAPVASLSLP